MLAPLLVQARQSAQLGSLEQRFLLQTRSLAFVDLISVLPLQKRTRFLSQESVSYLGTAVRGMCKGYCGPVFDIYIYILYLTSTAPPSLAHI